MNTKQKKIIEMKSFPAIEINHNTDYHIYLTSIDAKVLRSQINVERMRFNEKTGTFEGYQRKIDEKHVGDILNYLREGMTRTSAVMTDAVTIALKRNTRDEKGVEYDCKFTSSMPKKKLVRVGTIELPFQYYVKEDGTKTGIIDTDESLGWVVDGQHRLEALWRHDYTEEKFPIPISIVFSEDITFNRELFVRTNLRLPIKRNLLLRDLQQIRAAVSKKYAVAQLCMRIVEELEKMEPFKDMIEKKV